MGGILIWLVFGALIGYLAASKRRWSPVAGVLGGALLGLLSPLLFLVSSTTRSDKTKVCPHCAELVKEAANVCKHCGRPL